MTLSSDEITTSGLTHIGTVRKKNEDAILSMPSAGLWAVADGMGGHLAGDFASQCIVEHLQKAALAYSGSELVSKAEQALKDANDEIYAYSQSLPDQKIVGSTVTVLIMEGEHYHCFWSGDSRCYLLRESQFVALTRDHTEAQEMVEQGRLSIDLVDSVPESNVLTQAIGIGPDPEIEYITEYIYEQDTFLLCSDGLNKVFSDAVLKRSLLRSQASIEMINQRFFADALQKGAPDNISSIIVSI